MSSVATPQRLRLDVHRRPLDDAGWNAFVEGRDDALPFHHASWARVLTTAYGYNGFVAVATDADGHVRAGVPVVEVRRPLGARRWLALPFTDYCPPLAEDAASAAALVEGLEQMRSDGGVASVEYRAEATPESYAVGVRHVLQLDPDPAITHAGFKNKQALRKAAREGILSTRISRERRDFDAFLRLHLVTRRRLGVPIQPRAFFEPFWEQLIVPGRGYVVVAEAEGVIVSAAVILTGGSTAIYKFGASDTASWQLRPNNVVLWKAIEHACLGGYTSFDFGRTETAHKGLRAFKSGWGGEELPLRYSLSGRSAPTDVDDQSGTSLSATIIRHAPPLVCRLAGRALYRYAA